MGTLTAPQFVTSMKSYAIANAALVYGTAGYMQWTPTLAQTDARKWTQSHWIARTRTPAENEYIISSYETVGWPSGIKFDANSKLNIIVCLGGALVCNLTSAQACKDSAAWYHVVVAYDSTQAVASDRVRVYINGTQITSFVAPQYPVLNAVGTTSKIGVNQVIGLYYNAANEYKGYIAELYFVDGQALMPSEFGKLDPTTGNWVSKKYTGTYGANGFYLDFSNGLALGADASGNGNNWTVTGGVTQVTSTPTNVYATWNTLNYNGDTAMSNGNRLAYGHSSTLNNEGAVTTLGFDVADNYWVELVANATGTHSFFGITDMAVFAANNTDVLANNVATRTYRTYLGEKTTGTGAGFTTAAYTNSRKESLMCPFS